ncbi:MAG: agglutinin biogenesis protein MshP [Nitrosomonadales bacterium]|nr:agglutinin biogenesis protein MshP [Nitrosomonadales bacterium]
MKPQRGFSLVTAVFLLVVLSALGTMMGTFFVAQQQSSALDVLGTRAYQAARAGMEWGAYQVVQSGVVGGTYAGACQAGPVTETLALQGTLSAFTVNVSCSASSYDEGIRTVTGGNPVWVYSLSASAATPSVPGRPDYVERQITATLQQ